MNRCLITATGAKGDGLLKAIGEWMELYRKDLPENLELRVSKSKDNDFSIAITPQLDNERFIYLVNYIHWARKIGKCAVIEGFTFARDPEWFQEEMLRKEVMVYISADDDEGDNVNVVDENNHVCKVEFAIRKYTGEKFKQEKTGKIYHRPLLGHSSVVKTFRLGKSFSADGSSTSGTEREPGITSRFWIIAGVAVFTMAASLIVSVVKPDVLQPAVALISIAIIMWFYVDHEILGYNDLYLYSLMITGLLIGFGVNWARMGVLSPLSLLFVQWPLRQVYIMIFHEEPETVSRGGGSAQDNIYSILLMIAPALPFLL